MAAGLGFKDFVTGEVLTAADVDGYLMQGVWVFASAAARSAAVTSPQEGNFSYLKDTNSTEYYTGSAWVAVGGGGAGASYAVFADEKTSGTNGGTATNGAWRTRDINTTRVNGITGASLASNQITLAAGTYMIDAFATSTESSNTQTRFYNITDSSVAILGITNYVAGAGGTTTLGGQVVITGTKVFELQQRVSTTVAGNGFGVATSWGTECYSYVMIAKVA